ncbi:MAG: hypothetical protein IKD12_07455 [Paludibacteraceae bacterium]|nr:hypothetical protein [Paludibacteraceae bacterium]
MKTWEQILCYTAIAGCSSILFVCTTDYCCNYLSVVWSAITAVATILLFVAALVGFKKSRNVARMEASLEFCAKMHEHFQDGEFKQIENRIREGLSEQKVVCAISELPDSDLQKDIDTYCGYIDNIGVLTKNNIIKPEIVIAYYGSEILLNYDLIKPYLDLERKLGSDKINKFSILQQDSRLIKNALCLKYAHFELLALQIRKEGPRIVKHFEKKLKKHKAI